MEIVGLHTGNMGKCSLGNVTVKLAMPAELCFGLGHVVQCRESSGIRGPKDVVTVNSKWILTFSHDINKIFKKCIKLIVLKFKELFLFSRNSVNYSYVQI